MLRAPTHGNRRTFSLGLFRDWAARCERRGCRWHIPALLSLFTTFFYWPILFASRLSFPWDASDFFYPYFAFVHEELRHFRLPLWDPYAFSGFPIIGDPEAQIFYPPNWLMVLLHPFSPLPFRLVEIQEIAHFFLAGLFMFYLAKDYTGETVSALFGGILFMSSGAMVAHTEHVASINAMAWYPLVFLLARRGLRENKLYWTVAAGLFLGMENLTGHWQHAVYLGLLLFLYFAYEACAGPQRLQLWPRWIYQLVLIAAVGAGLAMVQILPTYELSTLSIRDELTYWDITTGNRLQFLWTLFLPNYFGGLHGVPYLQPVAPGVFNPSDYYVFLTVPGCLLALIGLIEMARRRNVFWLAVILLFTDLALGSNGLGGGHLDQIPVLQLFRRAPIFFDVANFGLCLMAAVGIRALLEETSRAFYRKPLPLGLLALLLIGTGLGLVLQFAWKIHGWYHMLAVLALFCLLVTALLRGQLGPQWARWAILGLVLFQLVHNNRNQPFNASREDPRQQVAYDYAAARQDSLQFLRSDTASDFRVAAWDGSPWGSNGWNLWRIPAIYGWNPIMLRRYRQYIRQFTQADSFALSYGGLLEGGPDQRVDSPMLDLLGMKYLLVVSPVEQKHRLAESAKFQKVHAEINWRTVYRNQDYLSRAWFYPHAYILPDARTVLALMNSRWFQMRRDLLFAEADLAGAAVPAGEQLRTLVINPDQVAASSAGRVAPDDSCAQSRLKYQGWSGTGNWVRYDFTAPAEPGRYLLLAEYTAAGAAAPEVAAEIAQGDRKQLSAPAVLLRTFALDCKFSRTADLGQFDLAPGVSQLTLKLAHDAGLDLYSLWLVRLPDAVPPAPGDFSFRDFSVSATRIAFQAQLPQPGDVLVNEITYPGWEASIDGKPTQLFPADGIFRAVWAPAGAHQIEMRFRPRHLALGAAVSLISLAAVAIALGRLRGSRRPSS